MDQIGGGRRPQGGPDRRKEPERDKSLDMNEVLKILESGVRSYVCEVNWVVWIWEFETVGEA